MSASDTINELTLAFEEVKGLLEFTHFEAPLGNLGIFICARESPCTSEAL